MEDTHNDDEFLDEDYSAKFSGRDRTWLWKKWGFFSIPLTLYNFGMIVIVIIFPAAAFWLVIPVITLSHVRDVLYILVSLFARIFRHSKRNGGKRVPIVAGQSVQIVCLKDAVVRKKSQPTVKDVAPNA